MRSWHLSETNYGFTRDHRYEVAVLPLEDLTNDGLQLAAGDLVIVDLCCKAVGLATTCCCDERERGEGHDDSWEGAHGNSSGAKGPGNGGSTWDTGSLSGAAAGAVRRQRESTTISSASSEMDHSENAPTLAAMTFDVHKTVDEQLRRTRQRYTRGRRQLIDVLLGADRPVTIPELIELGAAQSQSSLYRNLAILEQCGAVHRVTSSDDVTRFELTEELSEHHHHLVCSVCGRLEDVTLPLSIEQALIQATEAASGQFDFNIEAHRLELIGTCASCT